MRGAFSLVLLLGGVNAACVGYRPPPATPQQTGSVSGAAPTQVWAVRAGRRLTGRVELKDGQLYGAGVDRKVYAVDIQPGMLELLNRAVANARLTNVVPVLAAVDDPRLPEQSLDLALMVDVYHELSSPQVTLGHLKRALKPGGRLVLLEYRAEDPDVPILPEHKMTKAQVKQEIEHEGFRQLRVYDDLPRQHLIVFTRP